MASIHIGHTGKAGHPGTLRQLHKLRTRLSGRKAGKHRKGYGRTNSGRKRRGRR
jgi:hypothetical protein